MAEQEARRKDDGLKARLAALKEFALDAERVHVLIALTNQEKLGTTGKKTGSNLYDLAHAYYSFSKAGFTVHFVSPLGGQAPIDPQSLLDNKEDAICQEFLQDEDALEALQKTKSPSSIDPTKYMMIFLTGGHGALYDFPGSAELQKLTAQIYELGGIVGAICHGPAGLLNVKLSNGDFLLSGKKVTGRSTAEETLSGYAENIPLNLEESVKSRSSTFIIESAWQPNVVRSGQIVTGQNPGSSRSLAQALVDRIRAL